MPKKRKFEMIQCMYFCWRLYRRQGVWQANGRSNKVDVGRHSLGTRDPDEARTQLHQLDMVQAAEHGPADRSVLDAVADAPLTLEEGRELYEEHVRRPRVTGGARPKTAQRYKAVLDKFLPFSTGQGVRTWNAVDARLLQRYAAHLEKEEYAYRTIYLELNTLKQIVKWLVRKDHLKGKPLIELAVTKADGTTTYCWRSEEVQAMVERCRQHPDLMWLGGVIVALACTGLRISELISLRWSDLDLESKLLKLTDETAAPKDKGQRRQLKTGRGRSFPINPDLLAILAAMERHGPFVFYGPRGGRLKADTVRRIFVRDVLTPFAKQFSSPDGQCGFIDGRLHSFRHYFCSTCANNGVPEQMVMRWLGHQESDLIRLYYHLHDDEARRMSGLNFLGEAGGRSTSE